MQRSVRLDEDCRVGDGGRGGHGRVFGVVLLPKKLFQTCPGVSQFRFQERWGWTFPFSPLYTAQIREEHAYCGSQRPLYLNDFCRLGLFLAYCAKGSNRSNFPWIRLPRWPRWEVASYLHGACKCVSEFLKLPSRQCSASRVMEYDLRCHSLPPERVAGCLHSSRTLGRSSENSTRLLVGLLAVGFRRSLQRAAKDGCISSVANEPFETSTPRSSWIERSSSLPMRWCCAACVPCRESGGCRCGSRLTTSILSVSHFWGLGQFKREFHKELTHNFMEPCAVYWSQSWRLRTKRPWAVVRSSLRTANNEWCVDRQELLSYLTFQVCKTNIPGHTGLGSRKGCLHSSSHQIYSGSSWLDTCWVPRGWRHSSG